MPDSMHLLDAGLPRFKGSESTEDKVAAIQNYLYMLLEELRYILRHLGAENFTAQGAQEVVEQALGADVEGISGGESNVFETIVANTIINNSFYTNEMYATYGEVADLTVWRLRTDYMRARNYLRGSRADLNYIDIHEEQMDFITGSVIGGPVQLTRDGMAFYWTDATKTRMTFLTTTAWPVMVYEYAEEVKLSIRFETITLTDETTTYAPVFILGAGDENGNSRGYLFKEQNDMILRYVDSGGGNTDIMLSDYVDAKHRRLASCSIDTVNGTVAYTVEGDEAEYSLTFVEDGDTVTYTWPDGFECEVTVT